MAYITSSYYYNDYGGAASSEIDGLILRACDIIDAVTNHAIAALGGFDMLPSDFIKEKVMLAVAAEVDYLDRNGGLAALDSSTPVQMTLGSFSYMNGAGTSERLSFPISPLAAAQLEPTGLLFRGVALG